MTRLWRSALYGAGIMDDYLLSIFNTHISFQSCNHRSQLTFVVLPDNIFWNSCISVIRTKDLILLYGKPSLRQIPVLWLALSRSGFCSTDRFHGNGPIRVFLFWSETGKFKICNQNSEKKVWIMSFFTLKLSEEAKKVEIFPKFQR